MGQEPIHKKLTEVSLSCLLCRRVISERQQTVPHQTCLPLRFDSLIVETMHFDPKLRDYDYEYELRSDTKNYTFGRISAMRSKQILHTISSRF